MEGKLIYEHHLDDPLAIGLGDEFVEANQWHSQGAQTLQSLLYTSDSRRLADRTLGFQHGNRISFNAHLSLDLCIKSLPSGYRMF